MALRWHRSKHTCYHYFGDEKYDYGYVHRTPDGREWYPVVYTKLLKRCPRLKDAKRLVEKEVRSQTKIKTNNKKRR